MVDFKKTFFVCLVFLGLISLFNFIGGFFTCNSNVKDNLIEMAITDPDVTILYDKIEAISSLRIASYDSGDTANDDIIKIAISSLQEDDYKTKTIKPVKIVCQVTNTISFISSKKCDVKIISNDTIMKYQEKLFNTKKELEYIDINVNGLDCKNNGKNYYCLIDEYKNNRVNYSIIKEAFQDGDSIIIRDYYLSILIGDNQRCIDIFCEDKCLNNSDNTFELSDDFIKNNGTLYENVFMKNSDGDYYLAKSFIYSE